MPKRKSKPLTLAEINAAFPDGWEIFNGECYNQRSGFIYDQDLGVELHRQVFAKNLSGLETKIRREITRRAKGGK